MYWMELSQREFSEIFSGWQLDQMVEVSQLHSGLMQVYNLGRVDVNSYLGSDYGDGVSLKFWFVSTTCNQDIQCKVWFESILEIFWDYVITMRVAEGWNPSPTRENAESNIWDSTNKGSCKP